MLSDAAILLHQLLQVPSVTLNMPGSPSDAQKQASAVLDIAENFARNHAGIDKTQRFVFGQEHEAVDNLLIHSHYASPGVKTRPLVYLGHFDVVPADAREWSSPPFEGRIVNNAMVGRGAVDMKGGNAAFLAALKYLRQHHIPHNVVGLFTTDEEWEAEYGMNPLLAEFKKLCLHENLLHGTPPQSFWVGEPSSIHEFGDAIATGRRGSLNGHVYLKGVSGHVAQPSTFQNVLDDLPLIMETLKSIKFDDAPEWLEKTTLQLTYGESEGKRITSIIPPGYRQYFNIRYTDTYTPAKLSEILKDALSFWEDTTEIVWNNAANPYLSRGPSPLLETLQQRIFRHTGKFAKLTHQGGTSDGRFIHQYFPDAEILEFGPLIQTMHQPDENIPLKHLDLLTQLYIETIAEYCAPNV